MGENRNKEAKACCCHGKGSAADPAPRGCCSSQGDEAFLMSLDEEMRALILDGSTAPELVTSGEETFAACERRDLPAWTAGLWELHKEVIDSTIEGGWDNGIHPWNREMQDFWKYPIAFASYGIPSLIMTDPGLYEDACDHMRKSILLMKDAGAFDEWTRLEFGKDPVTVMNVMYKGHLNLMYGLYRLISGSDEFDEEYRHLTSVIVSEARRNGRERGFWGIECEPDQYFPPCNSVGMLSEKVHDLNFGTDYVETVAAPTAAFIRDRLVDPETGINLFRYHPSHDYAEPYIIGDCWTTSMLHYFSPDQCQKAFEGIKREFLADIKGGKECYLKANRFTHGASTDYEQSTWVLYVPLMSREFGDVELWEKINRFMNDMYGIELDNGIVRFKDADPTIETHAEGYLFLGAIHLGWDKVLAFDWDSFRTERGR